MLITAFILFRLVGARCSIDFASSVPEAYADRVCESARENSCLFDILSRWKSVPPKVPSGFLTFSKVYVIHQSSMPWRRDVMKQRAAAIGISVDEDDGVLSFVDDFDSFSRKELTCLTRGSLPLKELSANAKHYAAMLDMVRHNIKYALVVEDDAAFESGSKLVKGKVEEFDVFKHYSGSRSFNETMAIVNSHMPTWSHKPASFGGQQQLPGEDFVFDHLAIGACDFYWRNVYNFGKTQGRSKEGKLHKNVLPFSGHLSVSGWSCSRCLVAYVSSLSGAVRLLSKDSLPWLAPADVHLTWLSGSKSSENRNLDCLWLEPPVVWQDPPEDTLPDK